MTGKLSKNFHGVGIGPPSKVLAVKKKIQQKKQVLQQNPGMLNGLLQNIGQSNPNFLQIISQNKEAFICMICNEYEDGSTSGSDSMS